MKSQLNAVTATNSLSTVNSNFTKLAEELQDKVLYRDNPTGEPNELENDLDFNGHNIYNVGMLQADRVTVDGVEWKPGESGGGSGSSESGSTSHDPGLPGTTPTTVGDVLRESVSVFAWLTSAQRDNVKKRLGTLDCTANVQKAIYECAGKYALRFPAGVYLKRLEWKVPSNSVIFGDGIGVTVIKQAPASAANQCGFTNSNNTRSDSNAGNSNITIRNLEIVGCISTATGSVGAGTSGCGIGLSFVKDALIENVLSRDWSKHCFDVSAKYYWTADNAHPTEYVPGPSSNVTLRNCRGTNAGDDIITTHFSGAIYIENPYCYGEGTEAGLTLNRNGIEIDDGSYDVSVTGGLVENCTRGLEIKGHDYAPAATRVRVRGLTIRNCSRNIDIRHLRHYGPLVEIATNATLTLGSNIINFGTTPENISLGMSVVAEGIPVGALVASFDETTATLLLPAVYPSTTATPALATASGVVSVALSNQRMGYSESARDVLLEGVTSYAPMGLSSGALGALLPRSLRVAAYDGVRIVGLTVIGTDATVPEVADPSDETSTTSIFVHSGAKNVTFENLTARNITKLSGQVVSITGTGRGNVQLYNSSFDECQGVTAISVSGSLPGIVIDGVDAIQTGEVIPQAVSFSYQPETSDSVVRNIRVSGYTHSMTAGAVGAQFESGMTAQKLQAWTVADSTSTVSGAPQEALVLGVSEGFQDIDAGEGAKLSYKFKLLNDPVPYEGAYAASYKTSILEEDTGTALVLATRDSADEGIVATPRWTIWSDGNLRPWIDSTYSIGSPTRKVAEIHATKVSTYPAATTATTGNGEWVTELPSSKKGKIKVKGLDGVDRSFGFALGTGDESYYDPAMAGLSNFRRMYRKRIAHRLPIRFPDYDSVVADYGYAWIYPQCFSLDEIANEIFVVFSPNPSASDQRKWVAVFDWTTGTYKKCFAVSAIGGGEGCVIKYAGASRFLYIKENASGSVNGLGKYDITTLPANKAVLTPVELLPVSMSLQLMERNGIFMVEQGVPSIATVADYTVFNIYNEAFERIGAMQFDKVDTGYKVETDSDYGPYIPKRQNIALGDGAMFSIHGGNWNAGSELRYYKYAGPKVYNLNGERIAEGIMRPDKMAGILTENGIICDRIEHEGIVVGADGRVYTLCVHKNVSTAGSTDDGIIIFEEFSTASDSIDFYSSAANYPSFNRRQIEVGLWPRSAISGTTAGLIDPLKGSAIDTIEELCDFMVGAGIEVTSFYTSSVTMSDIGGATIDTGNLVTLRNCNNSGFFMTYNSLLGGTREYLVIGTPGSRTKTSMSSGAALRSTVTPQDNMDMLMELTSNTQLSLKAKGSDGVVRSVILTLA